jgi:L-seryl-tRNA(Ser) seleniumtransferase
VSDDPDPRRALPSVDALLAEPGVQEWIASRGRTPVKKALQDTLSEARSRSKETAAGVPGLESLLVEAQHRLSLLDETSLRRVLNGTGVILHTNLGRAPLAPEAQAAFASASGYGNVELDLERGERGSRYEHCAESLIDLTGCQAALVVNNNAAAVSLAVNELALGREVIVSRGELVEIGGSFRIPDVVVRSGARLVEVGTTNRTRIGDYRDALGPECGAILKVHPSNYRVEGFAASVPLEQLVEIGREGGIPVLHDIGSGLLDREMLPGFPDEPTVSESLLAGADLVTWSGDKLFGGPQAGILLGSAELIGRLRRNPLLRTFRVDKMTLAALEATLALYRDRERAVERIPALRMLREPVASVEGRARATLEGTEMPPPARISVEAAVAVVGGGSFPGYEIPSAAWNVRGVDADALAAGCRAGRPPLIGRIHEDAFQIDFRTIAPNEEALVAEVVRRALSVL